MGGKKRRQQPERYMHPVKRDDGKLTGGVYRFTLTEEGVDIKNDLTDKNLFASFVTRSPDCTGLEGGLDQPGEPIIWNGRIIASCFDLVTGPDKVNTAHEMPATLAEIAL
jgi:hypothetical protein